MNCFRGDTGQRGEALAAIFSCGVLKDLPFPLVIVPLLVCRGEQLFVHTNFVITMNQKGPRLKHDFRAKALQD